MHFAKNTKFQKHTARKIKSKGKKLKSQDLKDKKINSKRNFYYIW